MRGPRCGGSVANWTIIPLKFQSGTLYLTRQVIILPFMQATQVLRVQIWSDPVDILVKKWSCQWNDESVLNVMNTFLLLENSSHQWKSANWSLFRHCAFLPAELPLLPGKSCRQWTERCVHAADVQLLPSRIGLQSHRYLTVQGGYAWIYLHWATEWHTCQYSYSWGQRCMDCK